MEDKDNLKITDSLLHDSSIYLDYIDKIVDMSSIKPEVMDSFNKMLSELIVKRKVYKQQVVWSDGDRLRAERKAKIEEILDKNDLI
jgi:hypothetical protein